MGRTYRETMRLLSMLLVVVGVAAVALTLAGGGGPLARGVLLGTMMALLGAGRLALSGGARRRAGE
ncbi:MAG: hypothetical protein ACR2NV_10505 [Thermoleophilaceae bacterium]